MTERGAGTLSQPIDSEDIKKPNAEREELTTYTDFETKYNCGLTSHKFSPFSMNREYAEEFMEDLMAFTKQKAEEIFDEEDTVALKEFLHRVDKTHFSFSPDVSAHLDFTDRLKALAQTSSDTFLHHYVAPAILGEIVYSLQFASDEFRQSLTEFINKQDPLEKLQLINLLSWLANYAEGQGYADEVAPWVISVLKTEQDTAASPLARFAASASLGKIMTDEDDYLMTYENDTSRNVKQVYASLPEKTLELIEEYPPRVRDERCQYIDRVAKGTLATLDNWGNPTQLLRTDQVSENSDTLAYTYEPYSKVVRAELLETNSDNLDVTLLLQQLHRPEMRAYINQYFDITIEDLPLESQTVLLQFLTNTDTTGYHQLETGLKQADGYHQEYLESFLSAAGDPEFTAVLLDLPNKLPEEASRAVFTRYASIAEAARNAESYLDSVVQFPDESKKPDAKAVLVKNLLKQGKELLSNASQLPPEGLLQSLEEVNASVQIFANAFKALHKTGVTVKFEQLSGTEIQSVAGSEVDRDDRAEMIKIAQSNYLHQSERFREAVVGALEEALTQDTSHFQIIKSHGKIIGFFRLDEVGEDEMYFGSVNVPTELRQYGFGSAMLEQTFISEATDKLVTAHCDPKEMVTSRYIGDCDFVATKLVDYAGVRAFEIVRDDRDGKASSRTRNGGLTYEKLSELAAEQKENYLVFDPNHIDTALDESERRLQEGWVVTNYRHGLNADGQSEMIMAFERLAPDEEAESPPTT